MPTPLRASPLPGPRPAPPPPQFTPGEEGHTPPQVTLAARLQRAFRRPPHPTLGGWDLPRRQLLHSPSPMGTPPWVRAGGWLRSRGAGAEPGTHSRTLPSAVAQPQPHSRPGLPFPFNCGETHRAHGRPSQSAQSGGNRSTHTAVQPPPSRSTLASPQRGTRPSAGASGITCTRLYGVPVLDTTTQHVAFRDRLFSRRFQGPCTS